MADTNYATVLERLRRDFPQFTFVPSRIFCWSPANKQIMYRTSDNDIRSLHSLIHEVGHAILGHKRYRQDFELLSLEVDAWEQACNLAPQYGLTIDNDYIQDCLDSYRDWLFRRSVCPTCQTKALQIDNQPVYRCFNCHASWQVAPSRFCRPYRQSKKATAKVFADYHPW